jgi:YwiC-like protein
MWIVPMLSAALVTRFTPSFCLLFVCFTLLYVVHHPIVLMLRRKGGFNREGVKEIAAIAVPAVLLGAILVIAYGRAWLLLFAAAETAIFTFSVKSFLEREQRSFFNEIVAVLALTSSAPAAYYTITGLLDRNAAILYALNLLFFGSSIFYVKTRIEILRAKGTRSEEARRARLMTIGYHLLLVIAVVVAADFGIVSAWILLAFVPMLIQVAWGTASRETRMNFTRLGVALVVQSVIFLGVVAVFLR